MTPITSALLLMTPLTAARIGAEWYVIERNLTETFARHSIITTRDPVTLRHELEHFEPNVIVAAGGDGTVNLALQAMRENDALAVLPLGNANDLAHFLGVRRNLDYIGSFVLNSTCNIDLLHVNDKHFCTTGGLGMPAEIADRVNCLRHANMGAWLDRLGTSLYPIIATGYCAGSPPMYDLTIEWQNLEDQHWQRIKLKAPGLFVTNQSTFGHSMQVIADADNEDGQFELCVLLPRRLVPMLRLLVNIVQRSAPASELKIIRTQQARIHVNGEARFYGDGEILCKASHFDLGIERSRLHLLH
jgi:diacylglycerol kinase family enzyme